MLGMHLIMPSTHELALLYVANTPQNPGVLEIEICWVIAYNYYIMAIIKVSWIISSRISPGLNLYNDGFFIIKIDLKIRDGHCLFELSGDIEVSDGWE